MKGNGKNCLPGTNKNSIKVKFTNCLLSEIDKLNFMNEFTTKDFNNSQ